VYIYSRGFDYALLEWWNVGTLEYWATIGKYLFLWFKSARPIILLFHYSIIPFLFYPFALTGNIAFSGHI